MKYFRDWLLRYFRSWQWLNSLKIARKLWRECSSKSGFVPARNIKRNHPSTAWFSPRTLHLPLIREEFFFVSLAHSQWVLLSHFVSMTLKVKVTKGFSPLEIFKKFSRKHLPTFWSSFKRLWRQNKRRKTRRGKLIFYLATSLINWKCNWKQFCLLLLVCEISRNDKLNADESSIFVSQSWKLRNEIQEYFIFISCFLVLLFSRILKHFVTSFCFR